MDDRQLRDLYAFEQYLQIDGMPRSDDKFATLYEALTKAHAAVNARPGTVPRSVVRELIEAEAELGRAALAVLSINQNVALQYPYGDFGDKPISNSY